MDFLSLSDSEQKEIIDKREATICVIGLGKMGLPLAMVFTNAGYQVNGLDISDELVNQLNQGKTIINEPHVPKRLSAAIKNNLFSATTDVGDAISPSDFIILIIPVLTKDDGHADTNILEQTFDRIAPFIKDGAVVIQESTVPPGTTSGPLKSILEKTGRVSGNDFGIVFAPERTSSTRAIYDIEEAYPKILGGDTPNATTAAARLYNSVCQRGVIEMSSAKAAEAVKTFKGAYRDANIAIVNELAILADKFGVDVLEIIDAVNSEPSAHLHKPGIGVGGHCIPVYPQFLIALGRDFNYESKLLAQARQTNDLMIDYAVDKIGELRDLDGEEILIMGLAYRNAIKEYRMSPTLRLVPLLRTKNCIPRVIDPLYSKEEIDQLFGDGVGIDWNEGIVQKYRTIIICTDHDEFRKLNGKLTGEKLIFDGRYVLEPQEGHTILQPGRLVLK